MKDLPINDLLSSTTLFEICKVKNFFYILKSL
jgi:hypothetical protein